MGQNRAALEVHEQRTSSLVGSYKHAAIRAESNAGDVGQVLEGQRGALLVDQVKYRDAVADRRYE